jgi:hypothetical protein
MGEISPAFAILFFLILNGYASIWYQESCEKHQESVKIETAIWVRLKRLLRNLKNQTVL